MKKLISLAIAVFLLASLVGCSKDKGGITNPLTSQTRSASASYTDVVAFSTSKSSTAGAVYEVLPGPAVMNPAMSPTPFSDNLAATTGSYSVTVKDMDAEDSENSQDQVTSVNILFTGNNGTRYKIDKINIIHKPAGTGDHSFFGGVGHNKMMHGDTGIGTNLMPKMLSYITLWGIVDLKDADTDKVIAAGRVIHLMTGTRVRDENLKMKASAVEDQSNHNIRMAETHIILPPLDMQGNMSPVPGTDHGFLHMMFEEAVLEQPNRDWKTAYEILPGPAAMNSMMNPTPFSDRIGLASGSLTMKVRDSSNDDSPESQDAVEEFNLQFRRLDGTMFSADAIKVIHKETGSGDHTFYGGVGFDKVMHGNTGIGTELMPRLLSYITVWGVVDLKDGDGNVVAKDRLIHIMVSSRARTENLKLITSADVDKTDHSQEKVEAHIILPPQDMSGNMSPVPGTGHGFLHLMFEQVTLL
ncbi:MAG: hypothetical protein GXO75_03245 [Calditrichaeota bacterium]|nr:hypothetical protein [Calditrichota bacterium]